MRAPAPTTTHKHRLQSFTVQLNDFWLPLYFCTALYCIIPLFYYHDISGLCRPNFTVSY